MKKPALRLLASFGIAALCAGYATAAHSEDNADAKGGQIAELRQQLAVRDQAIRNLASRLEQLESAVAALQGHAPVKAAASGAIGQAALDTASVHAPGASSDAAAAAEVDLSRLRTAFERTLIDRGGLVLPSGTLELDTGLSYSHSSAEALTIDGFTIFPVLIVGDVVSERIRRDTMTASLTARLGLPGDLQAELRIPYIREESSRLSGSGEETKRSGEGLGDVEFALSKQLWSSYNGGLDVLGTLRWKSTTGRDAFGLAEDQVPFGTGFDALSASLTGVSVLDPVVFFGGLSYTKSLSEKKDGIRIAPGDTLGLQFGTAVALNLDTSINFAFGQQFSRRTEVAGIDLPGSYVNTGTLSIGLSRVLAGGTSMDGSLAIGLSEDSPDLQLMFSMPLAVGY